MSKGKLRGMKEVPAKLLNRAPQIRVPDELFSPRTVDCVGHNRIADVRHMNPDLVSASCRYSDSQ